MAPVAAEAVAAITNSGAARTELTLGLATAYCLLPPTRSPSRILSPRIRPCDTARHPSPLYASVIDPSDFEEARLSAVGQV